ncbi:MAG: cupin domain-containing protein [Pseudomonadota bacterium]|nr:cupin domain-containing protein [Pseudomonadota bacterium]
MAEPKPAPIVDPATVQGRRGTIYPQPYDRGFEGREKKALGDATGLSQFGVNLVTLDPGAMSSQRHWHEREDEFVFVLEGEIVLITDAGETLLRPGMAAGFRAGDPDGHHLLNRTGKPVRYLEVGSRYASETAHYPDIDLKAVKEQGRFRFTRKSGEPFNPSDK